MSHTCPYCKDIVTGLPFETRVDDEIVYTEVWKCETCGRKFQVEYEFLDHYLDEQGRPIEDDGGEA